LLTFHVAVDRVMQGRITGAIRAGRMDVEFADDNLDRLETDPEFTAGYCREIVRSFRKVMQIIRATPDERTFYTLKSLHFEKLKGDREYQRSMRLNSQWRLIVMIKPSEPTNVVVVVGIEDYH
jgi:toxin HigB-1